MRERWLHRLRVLEAIAELWWGRVRLARLGSHELVRIFSEPVADQVSEQERARLTSTIGVAVFKASLRCGFASTCLQRAYAARRMARRRGLACTVHYAVAKGGEADLSGHVWLSSGGLPVTGLRTLPPDALMQTPYGVHGQS